MSPLTNCLVGKRVDAESLAIGPSCETVETKKRRYHKTTAKVGLEDNAEFSLESRVMEVRQE
jgi:hypothetical protein